MIVATGTASGQDCSDGLLCTVGDMCVEGSCQGTFIDCPDDGDTCTRERCQGTTGECIIDEIVCSGPCRTGECDPETGCVPASDGTSCDDGNVCTGNDSCLLGVCRGDAVGDGAPCEDALGPCTTGDRCVSGSCRGELVICGDLDGNACTRELCNFVTGICESQPADACTGPCETGTCDPETGRCPSRPDGSACDDGNFCTADDGCRDGRCEAGALAPTDTPRPTATPSPSPTVSRTPTVSPTSTVTSTPSLTATRTATASPTATVSPSRTPTASPPATDSPLPSPAVGVGGGGCSVRVDQRSSEGVGIWLLLVGAGLMVRRRN